MKDSQTVSLVKTQDVITFGDLFDVSTIASFRVLYCETKLAEHAENRAAHDSCSFCDWFRAQHEMAIRVKRMSERTMALYSEFHAKPF